MQVFSGGAAAAAVKGVSAEFEKATGARIEGTFSAVGMMRDKLVQGEPCDLVILTKPLIEQLTASGHVLAGSARSLGRVKTGVAVRSGGANGVGVAASVRDCLLGDPQQFGLGLHPESAHVLVEDQVHREPGEGAHLTDVVAESGSEPRRRLDLAAKVEDRQTQLADHAGELGTHPVELGARVLVGAVPGEVVDHEAKSDELLREMQVQEIHMAIVNDEYGGTAGLVTFEALMGRIVGDLGGGSLELVDAVLDVIGIVHHARVSARRASAVSDSGDAMAVGNGVVLFVDRQ